VVFGKLGGCSIKIALFVEGQSDEKAMLILVRKILGEQVSIVLGSRGVEIC